MNESVAQMTKSNYKIMLSRSVFLGIFKLYDFREMEPPMFSSKAKSNVWIPEKRTYARTKTV